jgi:hypothetical protein
MLRDGAGDDALQDQFQGARGAFRTVSRSDSGRQGAPVHSELIKVSEMPSPGRRAGPGLVRRDHLA